jgi:hypothetical protein
MSPRQIDLQKRLTHSGVFALKMHFIELSTSCIAFLLKIFSIMKQKVLK